MCVFPYLFVRFTLAGRQHLAPTRRATRYHVTSYPHPSISSRPWGRSSLKSLSPFFPSIPFELTSGPLRSVLHNAHNLTQSPIEVNLLSWAQISDGYRNVYPYPYVCNPYPQTRQVQQTPVKFAPYFNTPASGETYSTWRCSCAKCQLCGSRGVGGGVQRLNYYVIIDTMRSEGIETIILNLLSYKAPHIGQQPCRCCYHHETNRRRQS